MGDGEVAEIQQRERERASARGAMTSSTGEACFADCSRLALAGPPGVSA